MFGCACYPFLQPYNKHKFQFHSFECIFLGYNPHHKGYSYLDSSGRVYISKDVIFHETKFPCQEHSQPISHTSLSPTNYPLTVLQKPPTLPCTPLPLPSQPASSPSLSPSLFTPISATAPAGPPSPLTTPPSFPSPHPSPLAPISSLASFSSSSPYSSASSMFPCPIPHPYQHSQVLFLVPC